MDTSDRLLGFDTNSCRQFPPFLATVSIVFRMVFSRLLWTPINIALLFIIINYRLPDIIFFIYLKID
jgi:hypothetical protein